MFTPHRLTPAEICTKHHIYVNHSITYFAPVTVQVKPCQLNKSSTTRVFFGKQNENSLIYNALFGYDYRKHLLRLIRRCVNNSQQRHADNIDRPPGGVKAD